MAKFGIDSNYVYDKDGKSVADRLAEHDDLLDDHTSQLMEIAINAKNSGANPDGSFNNVTVLQTLLDTVNNGIIFLPDGIYNTSKSGFALTMTGKSNITIFAHNAQLLVDDEGIKLSQCNNVRIVGLKITRKTQAQWGQVKRGILISDCTYIDVERNDVSYFVDNISIEGTSTIGTKHVNVINNKSYRSGEEPFSTRTYCSDIVFRNNEAYQHLGDGILVKGSVNVIAKNNHIHDPAKPSDLFYVDMSGVGMPSGLVGGGITCNAESAGVPTTNYTIDNNIIDGSDYGVGIIGCNIAKVINNRITNILNNSGIHFNGTAVGFNPYSVPMYDFIIENNYIDGVSGSAPGINVSTGAIPVKNGKLSKNTVKNTGTNFAIKAIGADITTSDNTVDSFQSGILIDGGIGYGNIIKDVASQYTSGIALQTGNNSNVYGNKFSGKGQAVINGTNGIFKDNIFEYTGTDVPIRLYSVATGNIIKDNIFPTNTGTAKILGNSATWYTDNDVYIDKVTNGTVYYIAPDVDGGGGAVTYTPDLKNGRFQLFKFNGTTAMTVNNPTNGMIGQELVLRLTNGNGSTAITPTFGVNFSMGTPVAISAGKRSVYRFLLADKWYLISATENF